MIEKVMEIGLQSKYSGPSPTFVDCQKDSQTTVGNGTHVKPVLLAVKIFAVHTQKNSNVFLAHSVIDTFYHLGGSFQLFL